MKFWKKKRIFLDYASITPVDKRGAEEMERVQKSFFANPSALYSEALATKEIVQKSRAKIADLLHAQKNEIIFISGGTEGNSLALLGVFEALRSPTPKSHVITTNIEHPAVLEVCKEIERRGGEVTYLPVNSEGLISPRDVREPLKENTILVSIG